MEPQANKNGPEEPKPRGPTGVGTQQLRFVVLRHEGFGELHWDLMIEMVGREELATWRVKTPPEQWKGRIEGERIGEHRRAYLDYEGEVSGGRGQVTRVEQGRARMNAGGVWLSGEQVRGWFEIAEGDGSRRENSGV